jgi:hypothetical protein
MPQRSRETEVRRATYVYVLEQREGGPYHDTETKQIVIYSSRECSSSALRIVEVPPLESLTGRNRMHVFATRSR